MIRLDVIFLLIVSASALLAFQISIVVHHGLHCPHRRKQLLGDFEKPVLMAWIASLLTLPQILGDLFGYVKCEFYPAGALFFLTLEIVLYSRSVTDVAFQLSLMLTAARIDGSSAASVKDRRRMHETAYKRMLFGFQLPCTVATVAVAELKECSDLERHYFWGIFELLFAALVCLPLVLVTAWCFFMKRTLDCTLKASQVGSEKVGLASPIMHALTPVLVVNALGFLVLGLAVPFQMVLLGLAAEHARARALYETVQCVACSTLVLLCQLAPVFFVHGIMQHCPTVDAQIKRFARQFDSSKLATYITEKGGKAEDALTRGRELCCVVRPSQLSHDIFEPGGGLGVASGSLEKCTQPDFFFSHSWRDSAKEKYKMLMDVCDMFEAVHGREPTVWIDKFCIDQLNIDESLLYLPVFASASRAVLVAVGPSYFTRLWCVWEMFVMSYCTENFANVIFWPLTGCDTTQLSNFRAADVGCYKPQDKDTILKVVESLNGDAPTASRGVAQFEQVVREDVLTAVREAAGRFKPSTAGATSPSRRLSEGGREDMRDRLKALGSWGTMTALSALSEDKVAPSHPERPPAAAKSRPVVPKSRRPDSATVQRLNQRYGAIHLV